MMTRNVTVNGHRTSLRLEPEVFAALDDICVRQKTILNVLCNRILAAGGDERSLASKLRVYALTYYRDLAEKVERRSG